MTTDHAQCPTCQSDRVRHCSGGIRYCDACAHSMRAVIVNRFSAVLTWLTATKTLPGSKARRNA
ncbi:MAG: hypothetical protein SH850_30950 [Planctomycetaceae bacterium]|nr:hypothetical protein [Planctomycetaceae bacterium]